ncbi:MAG: hypothetical protein N4A35_08150 [Flavobacteriales bacterium]|jgi:hypothetical protein|nr:hypothetical protein [Flavobacteriales bacterium]
MKGLKAKLKKDLTIVQEVAGRERREVINEGSEVVIDGDCNSNEDREELKDKLERAGIFEDLEDFELEDADTTTSINRLFGNAQSGNLPKVANVNKIEELKDVEGIGGTIISEF